MIYLITGYGLLAICQYTVLGERILRAQESSMLVRTLLMPFVLLCALSLFGGWGLMLYDWGTRQFKTPSHKRRWFLAMTLGMIVGVLVYYVIVFEMGMTGKEEGED
jgi:hypothetical protein